MDQRFLHAAIVLNDPSAFAVYFSLLTVFPDGATEEEIKTICAHWRISRERFRKAKSSLEIAGLIYAWVPSDENRRPLWREKSRIAV